MGIDTRVAIVYGVKLPWYDAFFERIEEESEKFFNENRPAAATPYTSKDEPYIFFDGMTAEEVIVGQLVYSGQDIRYEMLDFSFEISDFDYKKYAELGKSRIRELIDKFPEFEEYLLSAEPALLIYSEIT